MVKQVVRKEEVK